VPYTANHPSEWTLELLAEDALAPDEQAKVAAHVETCSRCAGEVEAFRSLYATLSTLPQLAPSAGFADAVMARVNTAPHAATASWLVRWLPSTQRGWAFLLGLALAPALPVIALVAWVATNPLVSPQGLWEAGSSWVREAAWSLLVAVLGGAVESPALASARALFEQLAAVPLEYLIGGALLLAIGIPLSVWTLYRTLRTPPRGTAYAH
jgi:anti-sigma factor RsiW